MDEVMGTGNDVKREKGREAPSGGRVTIRELAEAAGGQYGHGVQCYSWKNQAGLS